MTQLHSGRNTSLSTYIVVPQRSEVDRMEKCSPNDGVALIRSITTSPVVEQPDSEKPR
jgi:hypothetical protein